MQIIAPNQRIEPMTRSAVKLQFQSNATSALFVMAHPDRSTFVGMSLELNIIRDAQGWRRARAPDHLQALSEFLESDLQGSVTWCDEVLQHIELVLSQSLDRWQHSGNACFLTLTQHEAHIEHQVLGGPSCVLPISEFREAVVRWREFVQHEKQVYQASPPNRSLPLLLRMGQDLPTLRSQQMPASGSGR